jgi:hypothetical protein
MLSAQAVGLRRIAMTTKPRQKPKRPRHRRRKARAAAATAPSAAPPARDVVQTRSWLLAYITTLFAVLAGPAILLGLWLLDVTWRADTAPFWSQTVQVIPVLLLAIAVERRAFPEPEAGGSAAAAAFVLVVGTAAAAEIIGLVLLAFPCDASQSDCAAGWPRALTDVGTVCAAGAIPAGLVLLILTGAIQSGLSFGGSGKTRKRFLALARAALLGALTVPIGGVGVVAVAVGRVGEGLLAVALGALLGFGTRVSEGTDAAGRDRVVLDVLGRAHLRLTGTTPDESPDDEKAGSPEPGDAGPPGGDRG